MNEFKSILAIVPTGDATPSHSENTRRFENNAIDISKWLQCNVHFIYPTGNTLYNLANKVIQEYSCDLLILEDGATVNFGPDGEDRRVLESSLIPILLIPKGFNFMKTTPHSFLVPMSGEKRLNQALITSMKLATKTATAVDLLHVTTRKHRHNCNPNFDSIGDQLHHELLTMTDKISSESNPFATLDEQNRIRHFYHSSGFTSEEIIEVLKRDENAILALEWNGSLAKGHAETIKELLLNIRSPILFVRTAQEHKSKLKVGKNFRAA